MIKKIPECCHWNSTYILEAVLSVDIVLLVLVVLWLLKLLDRRWLET